MFDRIKYFILTHKKPLLIGLAAAVVFFIILSFFVGKKELGVRPAQAPTSEEALAEPSLELLPVEPKPEEKLENKLKRIAGDFTERFGSYSNQSNFKNLEDLKPLMTESMVSRADDMIEEAKKKDVSRAEYYGMTTKELSAAISSLDEEAGRATVLVSTQRREFKGSMLDERVFYQEIEVGLLKAGEEWKVDRAHWQ